VTEKCCSLFSNVFTGLIWQKILINMLKNVLFVKVVKVVHKNNKVYYNLYKILLNLFNM